jgi:hypothetical protein
MSLSSENGGSRPAHRRWGGQRAEPLAYSSRSQIEATWRVGDPPGPPRRPPKPSPTRADAKRTGLWRWLITRWRHARLLS